MTKEKINIICPFCESEKIVKYGKYKQTQKYRCVKCKSIFREKNYTIVKKEEKLLTIALLNLIKKNFDGITSSRYTDFDLADIMPQKNIDEKEFKNVSIGIKNSVRGCPSIHCNNPKVVLCLAGNEIRIIKLQDSIYKNSDDYNKGYLIKLLDKNDYSTKGEYTGLASRPDEKYIQNGEEIITKY